MTAFVLYMFIALIVIVVGLVWGVARYKKLTSGKPASDISLKEYGRQLKVNFEDCEIKTRKYFEERETNLIPTQMEMLDSIYNTKNDVDKVEKEVSVIIYKDKSSDKIVEYRSDPIYLPEIKLKYILEEKGSTIIYVDPMNPGKYFFDVSFLY